MLGREEIRDLAEGLKREGSLALVLVDLTPLRQIETLYGDERYDEVVLWTFERVGNLEPHGRSLAPPVYLVEGEREAVLVFLSKDASGSAWTSDELSTLSVRFAETLDETRSPFPFLRQRGFRHGYALVVDKPVSQGAGAILELIDAAYRRAEFEGERLSIETESSLKDLIVTQGVRTVFQPVADLGTLEILGFEALSRGPERTPLENPSVLFERAERAGLHPELERLCRRLALSAASGLRPSAKLFLKIFPASFGDPDLQGLRLIERLESAALSPRQIVLEVSERYNITNDASFRDAVHSVRELGFEIALDNCGVGFNGLHRLIEITPHYVKLHRGMIADCHESPVKQEMLHTMLAMSDRVGSRLIAHGIEKHQELRFLRELGITLGEGFLLGRPGGLPLAAARVEKP